MSERIIPAYLMPQVIDTLLAQGVSRATIDRSYRKWQAGLMADPCKYGRERAIALDCRCEGCTEVLCDLFYAQVAAKFPASLH